MKKILNTQVKKYTKKNSLEKLIKLYPELRKEISDFEGYFKDLKKFIKITSPKSPTYNKKNDIPIYLKHFINVIQLRLITQMSLIRKGLISQNSEVYSVVRAAMETISAIAYITDRVSRECLFSRYNNAWAILAKSFMGRRTKPIGFAKNKEIKEELEKSINVMTYINKTSKLISKERNKFNGKKNKNSNYFKSQYELISEYTHPNYCAFEMYWKIKNNKIIYVKSEKVLSLEDLGIILHILLPLIPIYLLFLKRAYNLQKELSK